MRKILQITLFLIFIFGNSQSDCEKYTIKYVPVDLEDAFAYFECNWSKEDLEAFKNKEEKFASVSLPGSYEMNLRNGWELWKPEGKLVKFLNKKGIYHPDDMSAVIFTSFHRKLNNKPIEIKKQVKFYQDFWKKVNEMQRKEYSKEFEKFKVNDTLSFNYLRTFVDDEQEKQYYEGSCRAKGILLKKTESDFSLKIKLIEICDNKGIKTVDFRKKTREELEFETKYVGDIFWNFYNDWKPNENP